jgi:hypothetical protein
MKITLVGYLKAAQWIPITATVTAIVEIFLKYVIAPLLLGGPSHQELRTYLESRSFKAILQQVIPGVKNLIHFLNTPSRPRHAVPDWGNMAVDAVQIHLDHQYGGSYAWLSHVPVDSLHQLDFSNALLHHCTALVRALQDHVVLAERLSFNQAIQLIKSDQRFIPFISALRNMNPAANEGVLDLFAIVGDPVQLKRSERENILCYVLYGRGAAERDMPFIPLDWMPFCFTDRSLGDLPHPFPSGLLSREQVARI